MEGPIPTIETDRVLPLHFFENSILLQQCNLAVSLVFYDVLDPGKLRESLEAFVKRDGWQRLGGRLRKNASGKIEWHIPVEFTAKRPAITFVHLDHGIPAASHPTASRIPQPSSRPAVVGDPDDLLDLAWEPGYKPAGIKDYLNSDRPVLSLRVNSFTDKTIAVLQWQHLAFDTLGMQYVVEGWSAMLWGKEDEIPPPYSPGSDLFEALAQGTRPATEQHLLADKRVGFGGLLKWGLGYGIDMLFRAKENRTVCVPETFWRPQLNLASEELRAEAAAKGEDASKVFLIENDVVTAWILQSTVRKMAMKPDRLVAGSIAMSLRKAFEGDLLPSATQSPYVGNAFGWANVLVSAGDVISKPLSWLASQVRRAINEQGTRAQHEAYYTMVAMAQFVITNWSKAHLFDLDFAPARKSFSNDNKPCRPSYVQVNQGPLKPTDAFVVLGKDFKGSYWTSAYKVSGSWAKFQEQLNDDYQVRVGS